MENLNYETRVSSQSTATIEALYHSYDSLRLVKTFGIKRGYLIAKRIFDFVLSLILILLLSPMLLFILITIRLITKESGIFKQKRIGYKGDEFTIFKFRTMKNSLMCSEYKNFLLDCESRGLFVKVSDDPRLYKFGKFLRKTSIDELPQLFNVLIGNMSLVGPRPVIPFIVKPYPEINTVRTLVKPGMSGLWQISARDHNSSILQMIGYDEDYICNCSFLLDIRILLKTIGVVIRCKGAI